MPTTTAQKSAKSWVSAISGRDLNTIQRRYEIEMKKISSTAQLQSLLDDPDATNH